MSIETKIDDLDCTATIGPASAKKCPGFRGMKRDSQIGVDLLDRRDKTLAIRLPLSAHTPLGTSIAMTAQQSGSSSY